MKRLSLRIVSLIMIVVMALSIQVIQSSNNIRAKETSGKCGDNTTWSFDTSTNTLRIDGTGEVTYDGWKGSGYLYDIKTIYISEGITRMYDAVFCETPSIETIIIPSSAYFDNDEYQPNFYDCSKLSTIIVDGNNPYYKVVDGVLYSDDMKTLICCPQAINHDLIIPDGVKKICSNSFEYCNSLTYLRIPKSIEVFESWAFRGCDCITSVGPVGSNCIAEIEFDKEIPEDTFSPLDGVKKVIIPDGVKTIGADAFGSCDNLEKVILPISLEERDWGSFCDCEKIKSVGPYGSDANVQYKWKTKLPDNIFKGMGMVNAVVSEDITEIGDWTFENCESLFSVDLPDNLHTIGRGCFSNCKSLEVIDIPVSVKCVGNYLFEYCSSLKSIHFPNDCQMKTFYNDYGELENQLVIFQGCEELETCNLPSGYTHLEDFLGCENLKNIQLPDCFEYFEQVAFEGCDNLRDIYYQGSEESWNDIIVDLGFDDVRIGDTDDYLDGVTIHFDSIVDTSNVHRDFKSGDKTFKGEEGYYYKDSYFYNDATVYNQSLATMSLCMAFSAFGSGDYSSYDKNVRSIMTQCGFTRNGLYEQYHFREKPTTQSIGCVIGSKEINGETLIAVALRGGGYEAEWASNVTVGESGNHAGFDTSSDKIRDYINSYIVEKGITGNAKIWITGYSRAGAVATQTAAKLNDQKGFGYEKNGSNFRVDFDKSSIYAYGFATPAGVIKSNNPHSKSYNNIFSVIDYHDPVPLVAPKNWGFDRYGTTKILPYNKSVYLDRLKNKMKDEYELERFGDELSSVSNSLGNYSRKLVDALSNSLGNRKEYVETYQSEIVNLFENLNGVNDYSFGELAYTCTRLYPKFALTHPLIYTQLCNNVTLLASVHANQKYYVYQMQMMDDNYSNHLEEKWANQNYRVFKANCPVDMIVYDKYNNEVAGIEYEEPYVFDKNSGISACIDENGQKVIYLPVGEKYDIRVVAREDCNVSCGFEEYNTEYGDASRILNFKTIRMEEDEQLKSSVAAFSDDEIENGAVNGSSVDYNLSHNGEEIDIKSDIKGDESISNHTYVVEIENDDDKGTIYGGGLFVEGSFAKLEAKNKPGYDFEGFYINGEKIENAGSEYDKYSVRFQVNDNIKVESKYSKCIHEWDSGRITKKPTYESTGVKTYTCSICGATKTETLARLKKTKNNTKPVNNKTTNIKKIKAKKKSLKVAWRRVSGINGYQIKYSLKKNFRKSKTITIKSAKVSSKTIKKLKRKKKYYFKIRTYIVRSGKSIYSLWSKTKSKKTK